MIIWITAILFLVGSAIMGYTQGAIRVAFSLVGLLISAALAIPCAPILHWIFPLMGITHPYVAKFVSPLIMFLLLSSIFKIVATMVHRKADQFYRYQQDSRKMMWERMNGRVGACLGLVNGLIYTLIACVIFSFFGYFEVQAGGDKSGWFLDKFFASAGQQLQETRMNEVVAPFNPATEKYLDASDVVGLLYHNRSLQRRLQNYPPFASWSDQELFKEMAQSREFQSKLKSEEDPSDLLIQPYMQAIVTNSLVLAAVDELDLKDLHAYLETGKSTKFEASPILGRWRYDPDSTIKIAKKQNPLIGASEWALRRLELIERYAGTTLVCYFDKRAKLEYPAEAENKPLTFPAFTNSVPRVSLTGKWEEAGGSDYKLTFGTSTSDAKITGDRITFRLNRNPVVYEKLPE